MLLAQCTDKAAYAALELFDYRVKPGEKDEDKFPIDLAFQVLTQPAWLQAGTTRQNNTMLAYHWNKVGKRLIRSGSEKGLALAEWMISNMGVKGTFLNEFASPTLEVLNEIAKREPVRVWRIASRFLIDPLDGRAFHLLQWLRGQYGFRHEKDNGALLLFPRDIIWQWIDEDPESRAHLIAEYCPKEISRSDEDCSFAIALLERYGHRDDVRSAFSANYNSGAWSGSASAHQQRKIQLLQEFLNNEQNTSVRIWLQSEIGSLELRLKQEKMNEERSA
jgi:hypothetical protein